MDGPKQWDPGNSFFGDMSLFSVFFFVLFFLLLLRLNLNTNLGFPARTLGIHITCGTADKLKST